ncbi:MAG TPA: hypothetical protein VG649_11805 [Candidatus Angelobacter sp.]|jgi:hypothetical protein|nr:hypothetical protein [Candidatus Angelobacter sp.]
MLDIKIDSLRINMENAAGYEHRIRPIATRAAAILADRLGDYGGAREVDSLQASPVNVNLGTASDEEAARKIADAWLEALALKLK